MDVPVCTMGTPFCLFVCVSNAVRVQQYRERVAHESIVSSLFVLLAAGMRIQLHRLSPSEGLIKEFVTNKDGRLEGGAALVGGTEFTVGVYEFTFYAADYFASKGTFTSGTPFLDTIPIRFGIDNPDDHYHVPLLVSPWSFSTYRGS